MSVAVRFVSLGKFAMALRSIALSALALLLALAAAEGLMLAFGPATSAAPATVN